MKTYLISVLNISFALKINYCKQNSKIFLTYVLNIFKNIFSGNNRNKKNRENISEWRRNSEKKRWNKIQLKNEFNNSQTKKNSTKLFENNLLNAEFFQSKRAIISDSP